MKSVNASIAIGTLLVASACGMPGDPGTNEQDLHASTVVARRIGTERLATTARLADHLRNVNPGSTVVKEPSGEPPGAQQPPVQPQQPSPETCTPAGEPSARFRATDGDGIAGARYPLAGTASVRLTAELTSLCGSHVAYFDVYAPDGSFYTRLARPFEASGEGRNARRSGDAWVVETSLPIQGTPIETSGEGTWSVNVLLDGDSLALAFGLFELYR